jgi:GMP synthase (glutamine-hydrolysing)
MKILLISHATFEQPGEIDNWAYYNGHHIHEVQPYKGDMLPPVDEYDMLIVMGGPQSPLNMDKTPYLRDEIETIKQALVAHKKILGICLGAQLIGEALGGKTEKSPQREIGKFPVSLTDEAQQDPVFSQFKKTFDIMHWHNDMAGEFNGMVILAESAGCPRQVFRYGDRVYGLQCHFEFTGEHIREIIEPCMGDFSPTGKYVAEPGELLDVDCSENNAQMDKILEYLSKLS